jgi:serine/threonine protein kinase
MHRPDTLDEVLALVRRSGLVEPHILGRFLSLVARTGLGERSHAAPLSPVGVLALMVEKGLLTRFQAGELGAGRAELWVGPYRVLDELGRGGMGRVYLAESPAGGWVAVKVLSAGLRADPGARERFRQEARAAAAVEHANVVRLLAADPAHDPPYLVMEYVDGVSLQAAVARYGTFSAGEAAAVGAGVAAGLAQAAAVGLVHRDIKPANVLVDRTGAVKVLDLGVARFESDPESNRVDAAVVVGTLDYLAPEQAEDSSTVDARADLYALGATLYFLLAGHPPFPETDLGRKFAMKQDADPPPVTALRPDVPHGLAAVVARLMARSPADRYPTAIAAAEALRPWAELGPHFPSRLFHPSPGGDRQGSPTEHGLDPSPTPPPPTRRIIRPLPLLPVVASEPSAPTPPSDAAGGPTVRLFPPAPAVEARGWWAAVRAAFTRMGDRRNS